MFSLITKKLNKESEMLKGKNNNATSHHQKRNLNSIPILIHALTLTLTHIQIVTAILDLLYTKYNLMKKF